MILIYSKHQLWLIKTYKCISKVKSANKRFEDKICVHDVLTTLEKYKFKCFYCNETLKAKTWQLDHFYSRAMSGKNTFKNICPTCKWCNQMKNALDGNAFIRKCKLISEGNFFDKNKIACLLTKKKDLFVEM